MNIENHSRLRLSYLLIFNINQLIAIEMSQGYDEL